MLQLKIEAEQRAGLSNRPTGDCWESSLKMCTAAAGFKEHFWTQLMFHPVRGSAIAMDPGPGSNGS